MKIFISYRRADSTYLVGRIKDELMVAFGDQSVFRDLADIHAGADFRTVLEKETNAHNLTLVTIRHFCAGITNVNVNKRLFDLGDYHWKNIRNNKGGCRFKRPFYLRWETKHAQ